jgi:hypothetical protein
MLLVVGACAADPTAPAAPSQAAFAKVTNENLRETLESDPFTVTSDCSENIVASVGTVHLVRHVMTTPTGTIVRVRANLQGVVGYGESSGVEYRLSGTTKIDQEGDVPLDGSVVIRSTLRGISKGPAKNVFVESLTTITFGGGMAPHVTMEGSTVCRG